MLVVEKSNANRRICDDIISIANKAAHIKEALHCFISEGTEDETAHVPHGLLCRSSALLQQGGVLIYHFFNTFLVSKCSQLRQCES